MSLNIEGATIGYDANEVQTAMNNLNTICVKDATKSLNDNMATLREAVDAIWVGASAEAFKRNMEADKDSIVKGLEETYNILQSELYSIVDTMEQNDEALIKEILLLRYLIL